MKPALLGALALVSYAVLPNVTIAGNTITPITGLSTDADEPSLVASLSGSLVAFRTDVGLVAEDTNGTTDGYLIDLETGDIELLLPQPAAGSITLDSGISFLPIEFSDDGSRLLMAGNSDFARADASSAAYVVFDFTTEEYLQASALDGAGTQSQFPAKGYLSGDGNFVLFADGRDDAGTIEERFLRRDLVAGTTSVVLESIDSDDGYFPTNEVSIRGYSTDGNRFVFRAPSSSIFSSGGSGNSNIFTTDIDAAVTLQQMMTTSEGETLDLVTVIRPDAEAEYTLLRDSTASLVSHLGDKTINEQYVVNTYTSNDLLGLSAFAEIPADNYFGMTATGTADVQWGDSSRYLMIWPSPALRFPGDYADTRLGHYMFDRETGQAWIAGLADGETSLLEQDLFGLTPVRANGGVMFVHADATSGEYVIIDSAATTHDMRVEMTASDGVATLRVINDGAEAVHNVGVAVDYPYFDADGNVVTSAFDRCDGGSISGSTARYNCRVGTVAAGATAEVVMDFTADLDAVSNNDFTIDIAVEVASLSGPDSNIANNAAGVTLTKPADNSEPPADGGGGGGPLSPWLLALVGGFAAFRNRSSRR